MVYGSLKQLLNFAQEEFNLKKQYKKNVGREIIFYKLTRLWQLSNMRKRTGKRI